MSPDSLIFTPGNWSQPQTVTVTGVDDSDQDGDIAYTAITAAAVSGDSNYSGSNPADVSVTNQDDDSGVQQPGGPLNDTGITWGGSYPDGNNATCTSNGTIAAPQDCDHGRDVTHNDDSDGHAGFSFTKLDADGNDLPASATAWSCARDNVTGLVWESKTDDGGIHDKDNTYKWGGKTALGDGTWGLYFSDWNELVDGSNAEVLCGFTDWRVPTIKELESIVSFDRINPSIDTDFFPKAAASYFWSSTPLATSNGYAWNVGFVSSRSYGGYRGNSQYVRLVRGGP